MGLTHKSGLFELINRLTTSEKRYIKQYINKSGEEKSNYAMLFDAIVKYNIYEDKKLKKKLQKTPIIKQWSRNKNYLYNYLLRVLQIYHQQNIDFEISNNLQQVLILKQKGLYKNAKKLLDKTKHLVFNGGDTSLLPFIAMWEMRLDHSISFQQGGKNKLNYEANNEWAVNVAENILAWNKKCIDVIKNEVEQGRYNKMEAISLKILNDPLYDSADNAKSPLAKWLFYSSKTALNAQLGRHHETYLTAKMCMKFHENFPLIEKYAPFTYISSLNNLVQAVIDTRRWQEIPFLVQKIETYTQKNKNHRMELLATSIHYVAILGMSIQQYKFEEALEFADEIENFLEAHQHIPSIYTKPHILLHHLVHVYIMNEQYYKALNHIDYLIGIQESAIYINTNLLLKLICLFELNEVIQLPYVLRSIYRNLVKKDNLFDIERILLNLLKASVRVASKDELKPIFCKYLEQFQILMHRVPKAELELLEHFNYLAWIRSKMLGQPLLKSLEL